MQWIGVGFHISHILSSCYFYISVHCWMRKCGIFQLSCFDAYFEAFYVATCYSYSTSQLIYFFFPLRLGPPDFHPQTSTCPEETLTQEYVQHGYRETVVGLEVNFWNQPFLFYFLGSDPYTSQHHIAFLRTSWLTSFVSFIFQFFSSLYPIILLLFCKHVFA